MTLTMASPTVPRPVAGRRTLRPVAWTTVAVLAGVMAFADGFVLTCQSLPVSDSVTVDYDA